MDPMFEAVVRARCDNWLREADESRLARLVMPARPAMRARVLVGVADRLIGLAQVVRGRYEPAAGRAA